ncbi:hypothetical protein METBIDRAFT_32575 [Metschnikowia bicuspidata var. bicuspidata NRRL YB-4993]|uniref:Uncharacterized protein n=1 Tax=Metschnikowia bicuspidata var. bicuspidata NRRL YB-4993 TaxID=869754 RepID=A0A1A0H9N6_9ASCO|nr:hypothetical protein METBIDRAFT_32575 [Metschnikowia bicuspidata var. bicuspidata NRRL YB-4993]OBA20597.1 hypothetical protein METBIDRAFT_32575 [Metschnikowia bicuspidata var. bicuspidata NRRL YB-4993]
MNVRLRTSWGKRSALKLHCTRGKGSLFKSFFDNQTNLNWFVEVVLRVYLLRDQAAKTNESLVTLSNEQ